MAELWSPEKNHGVRPRILGCRGSNFQVCELSDMQMQAGGGGFADRYAWVCVGMRGSGTCTGVLFLSLGGTDDC